MAICLRFPTALHGNHALKIFKMSGQSMVSNDLPKGICKRTGKMNCKKLLFPLFMFHSLGCYYWKRPFVSHISSIPDQCLGNFFCHASEIVIDTSSCLLIIEYWFAGIKQGFLSMLVVNNYLNIFAACCRVIALWRLKSLYLCNRIRWLI